MIEFMYKVLPVRIVKIEIKEEDVDYLINESEKNTKYFRKKYGLFKFNKIEDEEGNYIGCEAEFHIFEKMKETRDKIRGLVKEYNLRVNPDTVCEIDTKDVVTEDPDEFPYEEALEEIFEYRL